MCSKNTEQNINQPIPSNCVEEKRTEPSDHTEPSLLMQQTPYLTYFCSEIPISVDCIPLAGPSAAVKVPS